MTYSESIEWLYATQSFGIKLGLDSSTRLLREYLAFPHYTTKVIQVAGTNGKGSTCSFIDSLARCTGARTGLFTSPHLVSFAERIRVNGQEVGEDYIAEGLTALRELVSTWETHPTFFEITLALAMRFFRDQDCELIILEVGMGGRFDATTAVPADVTVLTPIALDHQEWLGETLAEIAEEKAAVFREGQPAISTRQQPEAASVIEQTANQVRSPLTWVKEPLSGYSLGILGEHQADNAALALEAIHAVGYRLSYDSVQQGLSKASHLGRFEIMESSPTQQIILDIAHNPHAVQSLVTNLKLYFPDTPPVLIFGAAEAKDIAQILKALVPAVTQIHLTPINSPRSTSVAELEAALPSPAQQDCQDCQSHQSHQSLAEALQATATEPLRLITGSAFLVGEAKALFMKKEHHPSQQ